MEGTDQELLKLHLLGEPRIYYRDQLLSDPLAGKEQALLIYLAFHQGKRFPRDHLATLLWGETSQERARYNLRRALWHLREALEAVGLAPDILLTTEDSRVSVPASAPCWVDVHEFEEVLETAFDHLRSDFSPASGGVRRVRHTVDLYRGEFLAGFSVSHAPAFEEWLLFERERVFQLLLRALSSLIQSFIAWGERREAISICRRLLELDPLQEETHRLLMRMYWDIGRRNQALRQYDVCREALERELGVEPAAATRGLQERIREREVSPTSVSSLTLTSRLTLPTPSPETISRPRLLALLDQALSLRLTLVSAPPGYGKTTLVAQWVRCRSRHEDRPETLFGWYRLSEADNSPLTLIEGLATCLTRQHPAVGDALRDIYGLTTLGGEPRRAAAFLVNALTSLDVGPLDIILDDVGLLTSRGSQEVLSFLLKHLPENTHLCILTRVDPSLPLPRLRVQGQLMEIRESELRFTDEETDAFLERASGPRLSRDEVKTLRSLAEGWAAPLWLAANARAQFAAKLGDVWEALFAYLRQEVLATQPVDVGDFLLRTAVLNRLNPTVCRAVLAGLERGKGAAAWLDELRRRNLFLRRIEPAGPDTEPQYMYHPLFLRFLRTELQYHFSEAEIEALHRKAGQAWKQYGDLAEWLFHTQRVNDPHAARNHREQTPLAGPGRAT